MVGFQLGDNLQCNQQISYHDSFDKRFYDTWSRLHLCKVDLNLTYMYWETYISLGITISNFKKLVENITKPIEYYDNEDKLKFPTSSWHPGNVSNTAPACQKDLREFSKVIIFLNYDVTSIPKRFWGVLYNSFQR